MLEAENKQLKQIHPLSLAGQEKHELETKISFLQEENQQLHYFREYQDKLISTKRFCTLKPIGEKECLWIQFKHEKEFRVCAQYGKNGHSKSWCRSSAQLNFLEGKFLKIPFYVQDYQKRTQCQYVRWLCYAP